MTTEMLERAGQPGPPDGPAGRGHLSLRRWADRLDGMWLAACVAAVLALVLQTLHLSLVTDVVARVVAGLCWAWFVAIVVIGFRAAPDRAAWAWSHAFDLTVLVLACPLWPVLLPDLLALQLSPAVTLLEATKLAKLVKIWRIVRARLRHGSAHRSVAASIVVLCAAAVYLVLR